MNNNFKNINDQIYGLIPLAEYLTVIIDTPEFQRLRSIWQLGVSPFVFPTANHTRFEHSIGTSYLASKLINRIVSDIKSTGDGPNISQQEIMCVEIAGLCHDLGHGPFSHFWDNVLITRLSQDDSTNINFVTHEELFRKMWYILKRNNPKIKEIFQKYNFIEKHEELVARLIEGKMNDEDKGKEILFQIVSNSESGLDVDKLDYLSRDSYNLGFSASQYRLEVERLIQSSKCIKIMKNNQSEYTIAFRDKEQITVLGVFQMRYNLHRKCYKHKTVQSINEMLYDSINRHLKLESKLLKYSDITDPEWILQNGDEIFWCLYRQFHCPIIHRILTRDLYHLRLSAYKSKTNGYTEIELSNEFNEKLKSILPVDLYRISLCKFSLGNKSFHPLSKIAFYNKHDKVLTNLECDRFCGTLLETEISIFSTGSLTEVQFNELSKVFEEFCFENNFKITIE